MIFYEAKTQAKLNDLLRDTYMCDETILTNR